jgi:hypothetical protein
MSNQAERDALGELLFREFNAYATALTEHGKDWAEAWPSATWPTDTPLSTLRGRFALAREAAEVVGVKLNDSEITQQHRERMAYRAMFPSGMPTLTG